MPPSPHREISSPIIVVGTHRSGTTFLGAILAQHPQVCYWEEPRHVWSWNHNYAPDDRLVASDATPRVARHIRKTFARRLARSGKQHFAEKTPSNCLRLPFVHAIFPRARYVHIHRDGRAVVASTLTMVQERSPDLRWIPSRLAGTPLWEWPTLLSRARLTLGTRFRRDQAMTYWGPRPPGWKQWLATNSRTTLLAKQWRATVEAVLRFRDSSVTDQWHEIAYETLVRDPLGTASALLDFLKLPRSPAVGAYLRCQTKSAGLTKWKSVLSAEQLDEMQPILVRPMERLGYTW